MTSPCQFDNEYTTPPSPHKRTKRESEELSVFDESVNSFELVEPPGLAPGGADGDATASHLLLASDLLALQTLSPSPSIDYDVLEEGCTTDHGALSMHDDAFLNETFLSLLDPIQSVARKSIHKPNEETDSKSELDDTNANLMENSKWPAKDHAITDSSTSTCDVLSVLTEDLVLRITSYLDAYDLVHRLGLTNRQYHDLTQLNQAGWDGLCQQVLDTKYHVTPRAAVAMQTSPLASLTHVMSKRTAYRLACNDAARQYISLDELCYNPVTKRGTLWSFRFKESAGNDWTAHDPWYAGQPCRKFVFLRDSTMKQVVVSTPSHTGTTTTCTCHTVDASAATALHRANQSHDVELIDPPTRMQWRFLTRPMDLPTRPMGSYVRIQVAGRDVPTYAVRRSPTGNWGFVLESCWGIYGSFELPRRIDTSATDVTDANGIAAPIVDEQVPPPPLPQPLPRTRRRTAATAVDAVALMQDDSMPLTNEVQWREAFLYNVGARALPEGDAAIDEFDRFWQGAA